MFVNGVNVRGKLFYFLECHFKIVLEEVGGSLLVHSRGEILRQTGDDSRESHWDLSSDQVVQGSSIPAQVNEVLNCIWCWLLRFIMLQSLA